MQGLLKNEGVPNLYQWLLNWTVDSEVPGSSHDSRVGANIL